MALKLNWRWVAAGVLAWLVLGGLLLAGAYALGHHNGVKDEKAAEGKRLADAKAKLALREGLSQTITADVAGKTEAARVEIRWRTRTLKEKVPSYVTPFNDDACLVPVGFVQLHDAAAAGLPGPAGGPDPTASGAPLSAVASTVIENYGVAYDWRAEAVAWRTWYARQKAAWEK